MYDEVIAQLDPTADLTTRRHSVLIVDDDLDQAEVLSRRLECQGFDTITAHTGRGGLMRARDEHPHLVLLDVRLPDMDGFRVCAQLADDPRTCDIPVIILSGMERPDIIRCSRSAGSLFYVRKPYDPNALLILIQSAIEEVNRW